MLRKKSSFTSHTSSSFTNFPPSAHPDTSASYRHQHDSATGVRRALSGLQNALHPTRRSHSTDSRTPSTIPEQHTRPTPSGGNFTTSSSVSDSRHGALKHFNYAAHSNGTMDSLYSSSSTMTPLTTDDDSSSTASFPIRQQRPRQTSKASSHPSPLSSFLNDSSLALSEKTTEGHGAEDASSIGKGLTNLTTAGLPMQLRVRHFDCEVIHSGYLTKFSPRTFFSRKQWKRRYFILHQTSLHCFKSSDPQHPLLESFRLGHETIVCVTDIFSEKRYCLQITSPGEKNWYVLADTAPEMSSWLRELKGTIERFRSLPLASRPGTHYSDSSEMSDLSSSSTLMTDGAPAMPSIPSQYEPFVFVNRSPSPPPRPPHPSHQFNIYQFSSTGNPNPNSSSRSITPMPLTPSAGSAFQVDRQEPRRKSNSVSSGQTPAEYASFGTVMEQAEALPPRLPSITPRYRRGSAIADFAIDHSTTGARTGVSNSTNGSGRRISMVIDRPETMITLPRRNSQRLTGSSSRPMSPVSSRSTGPNFNRNSPRSSLVVSPPPRSIHRPTGASMRHSTQVSPLQIAALGLQSGNDSVNNSVRSMSPTYDQFSWPPHSPLSRATNRHDAHDSFISEPSSASQLGPLQECSYRSPSRPTIITGYARPLSPTPSFSSAPTSPLPEPPRSGSPIRALKHTLSNGSAHRISIVPRHHDPEQLLKHRTSTTRSRSKSQELGSATRQNEMQLVARAGTSSPRLDATDSDNDVLTTSPASPMAPAPPSDVVFIKHMSLMHNGGHLILPPPPAGQQPEPPISAMPSILGSPNHDRQGSSQLHKYSLSTSSLRSVSSTNSSTISFSTGSVSIPLYGSAVSRKPTVSRDSVISARLPALASTHLGPAMLVPYPPQTALPPTPFTIPQPPTSELPMPPTQPVATAHKESIIEKMEKLAMRSRALSVTTIEEEVVNEKRESMGSKEVDLTLVETQQAHEEEEENVPEEIQATTAVTEKTLAGFDVIVEEAEATDRDSVVYEGTEAKPSATADTEAQVEDLSVGVAKELDLADQTILSAASTTSA